MIKRIIFDLDNTLIPWNKDWNLTMRYALEDVGITITDCEYQILLDSIATYEEEYSSYSKETMLKHFSLNLKKDIPSSFLDKWIKRLEECYVKDEETEETLKYLSEKYELVVLTNWFKDQQTKRLENASLSKYFKEIIGTDQVLNKPNKEAFIKAMGNNKKEECIMIGDNIEVDIKGAINAGIKPILISKEDQDEYEQIKNLIELKEMF